MTTYTMRPLSVDARQFTAADPEGVARWANARLRGIRLPAEDQFLQWDGPDGEEEARIGDWLVRLPTGRIVKHSQEEFELIYQEAAGQESPADPFKAAKGVMVDALDSSEWKAEFAVADGRLRILFYYRGERFGAVVVDVAEFLAALGERASRELGTEVEGTILVVDSSWKGQLRMRTEWGG